MPPNHEHDRNRTVKPTPNGPKERELAVALTVAVINASSIAGSLPEIEQTTLGVYDRMLAALTRPHSGEPHDRGE